MVLAATGLVAVLSPRVYEVGSVISVRPGLYGDTNKLSATQSEQAARSQIALIESEDVIRRAVADVGASTLFPTIESEDVIRRVAAEVGASTLFPPPSARRACHRAYVSAEKSLTVRFEPFTDLICVSFRHREPRPAVAFVNALVRRFTERYLELYSNAGAVSFFWNSRSGAVRIPLPHLRGIGHFRRSQSPLPCRRTTAASAGAAQRGSIRPD